MGRGLLVRVEMGGSEGTVGEVNACSVIPPSPGSSPGNEIS